MAADSQDSGQVRKGWGPRLDPTVNLGHLLSATVFLTTAGMAWAQLTARQDRADERLARLERLQETNEREQGQEAREIARMAEQVRNLDINVNRLANGIERLGAPNRGTP